MLTIETTVLTQNCIENLSTESGTTVGGPVTANLRVEFPAGQNATTSGISKTIPGTSLPASNGSDNCAPGPDPGTGHHNSPVSASDVLFDEATDADSTSETFTDPADLAAFVGPGSVAYSFTSSSNADITQPSEWDIVFVAQGTYRITVQYAYTGGSTSSTIPCVPPTTTVPGQTPPTTTPGAEPCEPPCVPPTTTVPGQTAPTTAPGAVPCAPPPCVEPTTTVAGQTPPTTATGTVQCRPPCVEPTTTQPGDPAGPPMSIPPGSSLCVLPATGGSVGGVVTIAILLTTFGVGAIVLGTRRRLRSS